MSNIEGFSLIELMIVVSIIGVLSAVGVPQYQRYQNSAKASTVKSHLANLASQENIYFAQNMEYNSCPGVNGAKMLPADTGAFSVGFGYANLGLDTSICKLSDGVTPVSGATVGANGYDYSWGSKSGYSGPVPHNMIVSPKAGSNTFLAGSWQHLILAGCSSCTNSIHYTYPMIDQNGSFYYAINGWGPNPDGFGVDPGVK